MEIAADAFAGPVAWERLGQPPQRPHDLATSGRRPGIRWAVPGVARSMQIPKTMLVERIRSEAGSAAADRADAELPEKVDTNSDADLLRSFGLDPAEVAEGLGGQAPAIG